MKEHEEFYSGFILKDHQDFTGYLNKLEKDGTWGGHNALTALSQIFECSIEIYQDSEFPTVIEPAQFHNNANNTIRLYFANRHYSSVRPDGQGGQLFNFQVLQPGGIGNANSHARRGP